MLISKEMYDYINGPPPDPSKIRIGQNLDAAGRAYNESSRSRRSDDDSTAHSAATVAPLWNVLTSPRTRASSESTRHSVRQPAVYSDPSRYAAYTDSDRIVIPASSTHARRHRRYSGLSSSEYPSHRRKEIKPRTASGEHQTASPQSPASGLRSSNHSPNPRYTSHREQSYADSDSFTKSRTSGRSSYARGRKQRPLSLSGLDAFLPSVQYETERDRRLPPRENHEDRRKKEATNEYQHSDRTERHSRRGPVSLHQQRQELSPYRQEYRSSRDGKGYSIRQSEDGTVIVDDRPYHRDLGHSHNISRRATEPERGREAKYPQHLEPNAIPKDDAPPTSNYRDGYSTESSSTRRERYKHDKYASDKSRLESDVSEYDSDRGGSRHRHRETPRKGASGSNSNSRRKRRDSKDFDSGSDTDRPVPPSAKKSHEYRPHDTPPGGAGAREMQQRYNPLSKLGTPPNGIYKQPAQEMQQRPSPPTMPELPASPRGMQQRHSPIPELPTSPRDSSKQPTKDVQLGGSPSPKPDTPPKGILKRPTEKFPEDPNAVREGVAPLKEEADKKGAPEGARWTKIRKTLVSPAALEGRERFEERTNDVIVLRVLSPEEIVAYSKRTAEIRYHYYRSRDRDRKEDSDYGDDDSYYDDTSSYDHDDDRNGQQAIEPPPNSTR